MIGPSPRAIAALGRRIAGLSTRAKLGLAVFTLVLIGLIAWAVVNAEQDARLVRADPDAVPADTAMMAFATGRGHGVFEQHCAVCHGAKGQGDASLGAANLTDRDWLYGEGAVSDIETVVLYGIRAPNSKTWRLVDMPAFAHNLPYAREPAIKPLTPGDINDLIQYLHAAESRPADGASAQRGAQIFADRGACYDCHGRDARGDDSIGAPNLTDRIWLYGDGSDASIFRTIASGRAGVCPAWVGRLSPAQVRQVALYVYAISHGGLQPKPSLP
jgi:cytochrome c oxidase cbb3-type subunit 3